MAIDKSLKQHYEMQGGVKNYLGKQKMVKAPKYWLSKPGHVKAKLAYITDEEEQILIDKNLYGSLRGRPNIGPAGLPSLQGGDFGAGSGSSGGGGGGGGNGSHDRGGWQHHRAATQPRQTVTVTPKSEPKDDPIIRHHTADTPVQKLEQKILNQLQEKEKEKFDADWEFEDKKIVKIPDIKPKIDTTERGNPFAQGLIKTVIPPKVGPTYYQDRSRIDGKTYGERAEAAMPRPSGVLGTLGKIALTGLTAGAGAGLFGKDIATIAKLANYKKNYDRIQKTALGKKLGLKEFNLKDINKDIRKQISKDDIPKVADRHPGTGKKKRTTPTDDRDGVNRILPETLQSAVSEGTQQYLSDEMKEQYKTAQNKMKAVLASGYYTDQDGRQIQLSDEQVNALTQWVTKIDSMLVDPVMMADGGRIDKALGGRVRDI